MQCFMTSSGLLGPRRRKSRECRRHEETCRALPIGFVLRRLRGSERDGTPSTDTRAAGFGVLAGMAHANAKPKFPVEISQRPVKVFEQQKDALAAALVFAAANPTKEHVHRLRTTTRRVEAQLALLAEVPGGTPGTPAYEKAARRLGKLLGKLRRAAGVVRDLDVQRKTLAELGGQEDAAKQVARLRTLLKRKREEAARDLLATLAGLRDKLARRMEEVAAALEASAWLSLPASEIEGQIRRWYGARAGDTGTEDGMHAVRKVAKLARYMGEANGGAALAGKFEALQDCGGTWHDLLTLTALARQRLGRGSSLSRLLGERRDAAYREYCERLRRFTA